MAMKCGNCQRKSMMKSIHVSKLNLPEAAADPISGGMAPGNEWAACCPPHLGVETPFDKLVQCAGSAGHQQDTYQGMQQQQEWETIRLHWTSQAETREGCD